MKLNHAPGIGSSNPRAWNWHVGRSFEAALRVRVIPSRVACACVLGLDPFVAIKGLISDMITKLGEEAFNDAIAEAYCDEELANTRLRNQNLRVM